MLCKKLFCDITIRLVTINFQNRMPYFVTLCTNAEKPAWKIFLSARCLYQPSCSHAHVYTECTQHNCLHPHSMLSYGHLIFFA
jgi:hypothetical protein